MNIQNVHKILFQCVFFFAISVVFFNVFLEESYAQSCTSVDEQPGTCRTRCLFGETAEYGFSCGTDGSLVCCYIEKSACGDNKCDPGEQTTCPGDCKPAGESCTGTYEGSGKPAQGQCSSTAACSGLTTYVGSCSKDRACCAPNEPVDGTDCSQGYTCKIDYPGKGWSCVERSCGGGTGKFCCKSTGGPGPGPGPGSGGWDIASFGIYGLPDATIWDIIEAFMLWILSLIALIAVIAFVISGMQYLLSAGNEKMIESAKRHMVWSIVGVIVAISGLVILYAADLLLRGSSYF